VYPTRPYRPYDVGPIIQALQHCGPKKKVLFFVSNVFFGLYGWFFPEGNLCEKIVGLVDILSKIN